MAPLIFLKEPDCLVTVVADGKEKPLLSIEFSTAVFTADHELQRFDSIAGALRNRCSFLKISPLSKTSPSGHGGDTEFNHLLPYALASRNYGNLAYHFDWPCTADGRVIVDRDYLSCPPDDERLPQLLEGLLRSFDGESGVRPSELESEIGKMEDFRIWYSRIAQTTLPRVQELNSERTRWFDHHPHLGVGALELKLNRFGHAMDPERGMLVYYGSMGVPVVAKMRFSEGNNAWYRQTPKEAEIKRYLETYGLRTARDFVHCFALGSGLSEEPEFLRILNDVDQNKMTAVINIATFVRSRYLDLNKPLRTIFTFARCLIIEDEDVRPRVSFEWDGIEPANVGEGQPPVTSIEPRGTLSEDEVAYVAVHNVLRPNGFVVLSVSYPGAQGDRAILPLAGTGRKQPRVYLDIIAYRPSQFSVLQENKPVWNPTRIQAAIDGLTVFKQNSSYSVALQRFFDTYGPEAKELVVRLGVGFWASRSFSIQDLSQVRLEQLDYFIYIDSGMREWQVWYRGDPLVRDSRGPVNLPETYVIRQVRSRDSAQDQARLV